MKNKKIMLASMLIVMVAILIIPGKVHAAYQSKPGAKTLTNTTADQFFEGCRNMETRGGVLGLNEIIEQTTYKGTSNNGIDAHMALNTEWGAIALLTDSAYGIGKDISGTNDKTSTGNATGVYNLANGTYEYVASTYNGTSSQYNTKLRSADARYFNSYSSSTSKAGDALNCTRWLSASCIDWTNTSHPIFYRGVGGLFGFGNDYGSSSGARAVVVCGAGL